MLAGAQELSVVVVIMKKGNGQRFKNATVYSEMLYLPAVVLYLSIHTVVFEVSRAVV